MGDRSVLQKNRQGNPKSVHSWFFPSSPMELVAQDEYKLRIPEAGWSSGDRPGFA